jgi:hypothetical protein
MVDRGPKSIFGEAQRAAAAENNKVTSGGSLFRQQHNSSAAPISASGRRKTKADLSEEKEDLGKVGLQWISKVTRVDMPCEDVESELRDGIILCRLANVIQAGSVNKIEVKSKLSFKLMENISAFLRASRAFNIPEFDLFSTPDLFEGKNIPQVITTIHALGKISATVSGFCGPFLEHGKIVQSVTAAQSKQVARLSEVPNLNMHKSAIPAMLQDPLKAKAMSPIIDVETEPAAEKPDSYSEAAKLKALADTGGKEEWRLREEREKQQAEETMSEMGGGRGSRKLSMVSKMEMIKLNDVLEKIFKKCADSEDVTKFASGKAMSETVFLDFCDKNDLLDSSFSSADASLIFASVKIGQRKTIKFDRFQEACRKVAVHKDVTYQEIIEDIEGDFGDF